MSTQPTDAMIEAGKLQLAIITGFDDFPPHLVEAIYLAMQSARTPPPCAGDDVERLFKLGSEFRASMDPLVLKSWATDVVNAIAALGTTPSIVGQEKLDG